MAHHTVDLLYIFLTYQEHLPAELAKLATTLAGQWLQFVNGGQPWTVYDQKDDGSSTIKYFGPNAKDTENSEITKPAYKNIKLCEELQGTIGRFVALLRGVSIED
jgi:hypothetical protein